jgi:protocatechuate 3,4-dioxygenase beta subunit
LAQFTRDMTETPGQQSFGRRRALQLLGGAGIVGLAAACGASTKSSSAPSTAATTSTIAPSSTSTSTSATSSAPTSAIPEETAGPFPGDGSNGPNVLSQDGVVRRDIRSSFGQYSGVAAGVPLTVTLTLFDLGNSAAPLADAAVYAWHCDRDGEYSMYGAADENYLRGVQASDADGRVTFTTIFPACYSGRWPHIHFEIYESVAAATGGGQKLTTSQLALPEDACQVVYTADGYEQSLRTLSQVSLASDNVFSDGWSNELAKVTGTVNDGYVATLNVGV